MSRAAVTISSRYPLIPAVDLLQRKVLTAHREFTDTLRMYRSYQRALSLKLKQGYPEGNLPRNIEAARRKMNNTSWRYHSYQAGKAALFALASPEPPPGGMSSEELIESAAIIRDMLDNRLGNSVLQLPEYTALALSRAGYHK